MTLSTLRTIASTLLVASVLVACGNATPPVPEIDDSPVVAPPTAIPATATVADTATPAPTPTETVVPATPTPTPIALSATDREDVLTAFKTMVLAEGAAHIVHRSATMALAEADTNVFLAGSRMIGAAAVSKLLQDTIATVTPPLTLKPFWDEIVGASDEMRDLLKQWANQELKVSELEALMPPIEERAGAAVDNAQTTLVLLYAFDPAELDAIRQGMREREDTFFTTATPTPAP